MARFLSQTLIRDSQTLTHLPSAAVLVGRRGRSSRPEKVELIEVEVEAESPEVEVLGMRRLEDAIHGIIVRRSAPDWLPFVPGASYWVPPPLRRGGRPLGVVELVGQIANSMTEEESLSFSSTRGWPSVAYFVEGRFPRPMKRRARKPVTQTDDEES
ncbi:uncharacterized protein [Typha angustifolia]|uniref:uncharacterized protein isoform X1 n=1 Tax=Typha angustifolia TaxID=59011 RepID=UPI003C2D6953